MSPKLRVVRGVKNPCGPWRQKIRRFYLLHAFLNASHSAVIVLWASYGIHPGEQIASGGNLAARSGMMACVMSRSRSVGAQCRGRRRASRAASRRARHARPARHRHSTSPPTPASNLPPSTPGTRNLFGHAIEYPHIDRRTFVNLTCLRLLVDRGCPPVEDVLVAGVPSSAERCRTDSKSCAAAP